MNERERIEAAIPKLKRLFHQSRDAAEKRRIGIIIVGLLFEEEGYLEKLTKTPNCQKP